MRVVVASCWKYRDAWDGFFGLFERFWSSCPYPVTLVTDRYDDSADLPESVDIVEFGENWCGNLSAYASTFNDAPLLLFQEDFFLNAPVRQDLIDHALEQLKARNAGMIRLYPCPGADEDYGDPHYGIVKKGSKYRISCQASIFRPDYLYAIASQCGSTPRDFELNGTKIAESFPDEVFAFKRESGEWPLQYLCSAIGAGLWSQDAKKLCDLHGIQVDWSLRGFQAA